MKTTFIKTICFGTLLASMASCDILDVDPLDTYTEEDVKKFCDENGLTLNVTEVQDLQSEDGAIVYQNMAAGSKVSEGANLRIKVVKNPEVTETPTDTGETE